MKKSDKCDPLQKESNYKKRLLAYSSIAGAILIGAPPIDAAVVPTDPEPDVTLDGEIATGGAETLNINFGGSDKFVIQQNATLNGQYVDIKALTANASWLAVENHYAGSNSYSYVRAMDGGISVTTNATWKWFRKGDMGNMALKNAGASLGYFRGQSDKYIGVKFSCSAGTCYGWILIDNVPADADTVTIAKYAYEDGGGAILTPGFNTAPTATNMTQTKGYNEGDSSVALDNIVVTDPDSGDTITATLTLNNTAAGSLTASSGKGETYTPGTGVWTITSTVADVNTALAAVAFQPTTNNDVNTTITTHVQDAAGTGPSDGAITLNVTAANDAPTATNMTQTKAYNEGDSSVALDDIVVTDPDTGDNITATLTLNDTAAGSLSASSGQGETYTPGTGVWTITSTVADVNTALAAVAFQPTTNNDVNTTITTHVQDAAGTGPSDGTITLNVTAANDAPTATNMTQTKAYNEGDSSVALDDIVVTDPDTGDNITATLTLNDTAAGSLSASSGQGETYTPGTGVWTITSTVADVNTALAAVAFLPAANNDVNTTVTTHIEDGAGAGPSNGTITLNVTAANDAPTATNMTQTKAYNEGDSSVALDDIVVTDPDTGDNITATLTLNDTAAGSLSASSGQGETYTPGTGVWTITSTVADVNTALAAVAFLPVANNDVNTTVTTHIEDGAGAGPSNGTITLNVTAANDAPTATNMTQTKAYNEGDSSVALDDIVVTDPDTGDNITATLTLNDTAAGSLSASSGQGETYTPGTGVWTITSTVADVNTALAAAAFLPATDNDADTTITTHIEDGAGAGPSDGAITLDVTGSNDPPTFSNLDNTPTFTEGGANVTLDDNATVSDVELDAFNSGNGDYSGASLTLVRNGGASADDRFSVPNGGSLTVTGGPNGGGTISSGGAVIADIANTGHGQVQITFANNGVIPATALANEVLQAIQYANAGVFPPANVQVDYTINDGQGGGSNIGTGSITVSITAVNSAPAFTGLDNTPGYTEDGMAVTLDDNAAVSDTELDSFNGGNGDYSGASLTLARNGGVVTDDRFSVPTGGNLTVAGGPNGGGVITAGGNEIADIANTGHGQVLITFKNTGTIPTTALANEVLQAVQYECMDDTPPASVQIDYTFNDGQGGGNNTAAGNITVTITANNDDPTDISLSNSDVNEKQPGGTTVGTISTTDPDN